MSQAHLVFAWQLKAWFDNVLFLIRNNGKHPTTPLVREKIGPGMKMKMGTVGRRGGRVAREGRIRRQRCNTKMMKKINTEMNQTKMIMQTCQEIPAVTNQRKPQITFLRLLVLRILMPKMKRLGFLFLSHKVKMHSFLHPSLFVFPLAKHINVDHYYLWGALMSVSCYATQVILLHTYVVFTVHAHTKRYFFQPFWGVLVQSCLHLLFSIVGSSSNRDRAEETSMVRIWRRGTNAAISATY